MLYIFLSWIYMLLISLGMGTLLFYIADFRKINLSFFIVSGLFFQLLLTHFYALFFPVDEWFYGINTIISLSLLIYKKAKVTEIIKNGIKDFSRWNKMIKIIFILIFIMVLMQSSVSPYLPDNESYYIQSIKWLNEYGLVKGLANLHIYFGQMSGWHILQSGFNFGFLNNFLNDINGFFLVLIASFSLNKLNDFFNDNKKINLFAGLIFGVSLFLFRFLDAPSPDLPVFLLFPCIVYLFCESYNSPKKNQIVLMFIFSLFLILVKVTVAPILILPFVLWIKSKEKQKTILSVILLCGISLIAFCMRNFIISGYIFYPIGFLGSIVNPDWKIPVLAQEVYYTYTKFHAFNTIDAHLYKAWSEWDKFMQWVFGPKLHGLFNKLILILLLIVPFFVRKSKALLWVYFYGLIQFIVLFVTSPQYRFFFHIILVFSLIIAVQILHKTSKKITLNLLLLGIVLPLFPLLISFNFGMFTNNRFMKTQTNVFKIYYFIKPHKNSQYIYNYQSVQEGNLKYNSPGNVFFWLSGDGELPSVNESQVEWFKENIKIRPQLRTDNLKDGFKSEFIK